MGETGAGITSEDQINMDEENEFMNKWSECSVLVPELPSLVLTVLPELIKDSFPWLWEMKDLISERPNITPVGLGNSDSIIDMSGYEAGYRTDDNDPKPVTEDDGGPGEDENSEGDVEEDEDDDYKVTIPRKRSAGSANTKEKIKGTSAPQKPKALKSEFNRDKKSKVLDRFADIASAEEVTNQKALDLKKVRSQNQAQNDIVKIKAKAEVQIQRDRLKAELRMLEKTQEHTYRMAQLNLQIAQTRGTNLLSSTYYNTSPDPSGLYGQEECSQSSRSFSTGPSTNTGFDFEGFDYDSTSLNSSAHLPTLPAPGNFESN
jgi:hypothetical protein